MEDQKVFVLGLSRTGTTSLARALTHLGIETAHWDQSPDVYEAILSGNFVALRDTETFRRYRGFSDTSVATYFAQLDEVFPGSKFILTVRDLEAWHASCKTHFWWVERRLTSQAFYRIATYGIGTYHRERFTYVYETHVAAVKRHFVHRPDDLLVLDICAGDGWERLCTFVDRPVPDIPFPHVSRKPGVNNGRTVVARNKIRLKHMQRCIDDHCATSSLLAGLGRLVTGPCFHLIELAHYLNDTIVARLVAYGERLARLPRR